MSDEVARIQRSKRFFRDETKIKKRQKNLKEHGNRWAEDQPHRLHKFSGMNCGNSDCVMCGNPRKFFRDVTVQERSFNQNDLWGED